MKEQKTNNGPQNNTGYTTIYATIILPKIRLDPEAQEGQYAEYIMVVMPSHEGKKDAPAISRNRTDMCSFETQNL